MENMWIMRELGQDLWKQCNQEGFKLKYVRNNSQILPGDIYCSCDIYVDVSDHKAGIMFAIKYSEVTTPVSKVQ
jgi:hypothetical protein